MSLVLENLSSKELSREVELALQAVAGEYIVIDSAVARCLGLLHESHRRMTSQRVMSHEELEFLNEVSERRHG